MIRSALIVDEYKEVRNAMKMLLEFYFPTIHFETLQDLNDFINNRRPSMHYDLVVMDDKALRKSIDVLGELSLWRHVIILGNEPSMVDLPQSINLTGYICKSDPPSSIVNMISQISDK